VRSHGSNFNPEHPAAVGQALRAIIFDEFRSERNRAIDILEMSARHQAKSLTPQNLAQIFLAVGNLCERDRSILELLQHPRFDGEVTRLVGIARRQISLFDERNTAEALRGLVFLGRGDETLTDALLARASGMLTNFNPADLVTSFGAVRLLDLDTKYFCAAVPPVVEEKIEDFGELELALGAMYLADLNLPHSSMLLIDRLMGRLENAEVKHLGMLAGAMKRLPDMPDGYCFALADEFVYRLDADPQGVTVREAVHVLDLLAKRELRHERFIEAFCREFQGRVESFSIDDLRDAARGLAALQEGDRKFFRAISDKALSEMYELTPTDISFIAWAFTTVGIRNDLLFNRFATAIEGRYSELSPSTAANIAWSFAPLDNPLARSVVSQAGRAFRAQEHDVLHARQLHIAEVAVGVVRPGNCAPEIEKQVREEIGAGMMNKFEAGVHEALQRLDIPGLEIQPFASVEGLIPDFILTYGERKIVLECDGARYHLTAQGSPMGRDLIHDQVFRRCGYEVVHILDNEWHGLSLVERADFLIEQLRLERYH